MKYKLFSMTLVSLAVFIGYLAYTGFSTIVPLMAATPQSAQAMLGGCESTVAVAERASDLPDLRRSPARESVGSDGHWILDPRPMMGRSDR